MHRMGWIENGQIGKGFKFSRIIVRLVGVLVRFLTTQISVLGVDGSRAFRLVGFFRTRFLTTWFGVLGVDGFCTAVEDTVGVRGNDAPRTTTQLAPEGVVHDSGGVRGKQKTRETKV